MKYIDAEKLIAEIERRKKQDVTFRERSILIDIETAIASLQQEQPSLPSNLDEAAEEFALKYDFGACDGIAQDCFKAGAKWQKEQIIKEGQETIIWDGSLDSPTFKKGLIIATKEGEK